jgi:DNA-binding MarR family transcriptional regulator
MTEDVVKALGYLTLGSRLKRLGERLQAQTQVLIEGGDMHTPAAHFPVLASLQRLGALSVGELSESVGSSQPGITRTVASLERDGLVRSFRIAGDQRVRKVELTRTGARLTARAKRDIWPVIEAAVAEACTGTAQPLLAALSALEDALLDAPLERRAARLARGRDA